jgi:hypothetical protein
MEGNFTTSGEVWIMLKCLEAADNITLNINDIEVQEGSVKVTQLYPKKDLSIQVCTVKDLQHLHDSIVSRSIRIIKLMRVR